MFFVVKFEMSNCTGLATVQGRHIRPVCLFGSVVSISGSSERIVNSGFRVNGSLLVEQNDGICAVGSGERGFYKKRFFVWQIRRFCCGGFRRRVKNGSFGS